MGGDLFHGLEGFVAYHMFDPAGVFLGGSGVHAQLDQGGGEQLMPLVDAFRDLPAGLREVDIPLGGDGDVILFP